MFSIIIIVIIIIIIIIISSSSSSSSSSSRRSSSSSIVVPAIERDLGHVVDAAVNLGSSQKWLCCEPDCIMLCYVML